SCSVPRPTPPPSLIVDAAVGAGLCGLRPVWRVRSEPSNTEGDQPSVHVGLVEELEDVRRHPASERLEFTKGGSTAIFPTPIRFGADLAGPLQVAPELPGEVLHGIVRALEAGRSSSDSGWELEVGDWDFARLGFSPAVRWCRFPRARPAAAAKPGPSSGRGGAGGGGGGRQGSC